MTNFLLLHWLLSHLTVINFEKVPLFTLRISAVRGKPLGLVIWKGLFPIQDCTLAVLNIQSSRLPLTPKL
jgi:hypothetical protein